MNIASELHQLLHGQWDYALANDLYQQIGTNDILKFLFRTGENSMNADKLREELAMLEPNYPFAVQRRQHVEEQLPENVQEIEKAWKELYKLANHTRAEIFKRGEDGQFLYPEKERGEMAHQVLNYFDEIERLWGAVDYYRQHGHIPAKFDKAEVELTDPVAMMRRHKNLVTYISKARAGKKYRLSIEEMEAEKAELERKLR